MPGQVATVHLVTNSGLGCLLIRGGPACGLDNVYRRVLSGKSCVSRELRVADFALCKIGVAIVDRTCWLTDGRWSCIAAFLMRLLDYRPCAVPMFDSEGSSLATAWLPVGGLNDGSSVTTVRGTFALAVLIRVESVADTVACGEERRTRLMRCHMLARCIMLRCLEMCTEQSAYLVVAVGANGLSVRRQRGGHRYAQLWHREPARCKCCALPILSYLNTARVAQSGAGRYSTELYGWVLKTGAAAGLGLSRKMQPEATLVKASSTALDFSSLPTPPGEHGSDGSVSPASASPRPATSMARARQVLERSCARDWAAAPHPEVVAEVERLQALLGGMIAAADSSLGLEVAAVEEGQEPTPQEGRAGEKSGQASGGAEEEDVEEGWSVTRLLFG